MEINIGGNVGGNNVNIGGVQTPGGSRVFVDDRAEYDNGSDLIVIVHIEDPNSVHYRLRVFTNAKRNGITTQGVGLSGVLVVNTELAAEFVARLRPARLVWRSAEKPPQWVAKHTAFDASAWDTFKETYTNPKANLSELHWDVLEWLDHYDGYASAKDVATRWGAEREISQILNDLTDRSWVTPSFVDGKLDFETNIMTGQRIAGMMITKLGRSELIQHG